jgi:hypothetical protein
MTVSVPRAAGYGLKQKLFLHGRFLENGKILLTKKNVSIKSKNLYKGGQAVTLIVSTGFVS